jgi:predicted TIM-barrel fold metal-dependent hydrolase
VSDQRIVDVHTHYLPAALIGALERREELPKISPGPEGRLIHYGEGNIHPLQENMADLELRLREMDEQGIDLAVISVNVPGCDWFPPADGEAVAREANDELAGVVRAHPDRLAALATLPMQNPEAAASELERTHGMGFPGAMVYSNAAGRPLDEPDLRVVFDTAAHLGVPIYIHPTFPLTAATVDAYALIPTLGFLFDTTTAALRLVLGGLYERHPHFKLVLAHVASLIPYIIGRIDYEAERHANGLGAISVRPSEHLRLLYTDAVCVWPPTLNMVTDFLGPERVMFGTDYPFWEPARTFETIDAAGIDVDAVAAIRSRTAEAVFGLQG